MQYRLVVVPIILNEFSVQLRDNLNVIVWSTKAPALDLAEILERVINSTNFLTKLPGT